MKYFWFVFSTFLFFLAASPCCEAEATPVREPVSLSISGGHSHDAHDHEVCSPFCTCTSCGCHGFSADVFLATFHVEALTLEPTPEIINHYTFPFVSSFEASIWQPPRLS